MIQVSRNVLVPQSFTQKTFFASGVVPFVKKTSTMTCKPIAIGYHLYDTFTLRRKSISNYQKYHIYKKIDIITYGSAEEQYMQIVPFLESIREKCKDTRIFLKFFLNKTSSVFSLRFCAVSVIPGYSVQRHKYTSNTPSHEKNVKYTDSSFLTGNFCGSLCNLVASFTDDAIFFDVFSIDAENETHNFHNFF